MRALLIPTHIYRSRLMHAYLGLVMPIPRLQNTYDLGCFIDLRLELRRALRALEVGRGMALIKQGDARVEECFVVLSGASHDPLFHSRERYE